MLIEVDVATANDDNNVDCDGQVTEIKRHAWWNKKEEVSRRD